MRPPQPCDGRFVHSITPALYRLSPSVTWRALMFRNCGYGRRSWLRGIVGFEPMLVPANSGLPKNGLGTCCVSAEPRDRYFGSTWLIFTGVSAEPPSPRCSLLAPT